MLFVVLYQMYVLPTQYVKKWFKSLIKLIKSLKINVKYLFCQILLKIRKNRWKFKISWSAITAVVAGGVKMIPLAVLGSFESRQFRLLCPRFHTIFSCISSPLYGLSVLLRFPTVPHSLPTLTCFVLQLNNPSTAHSHGAMWWLASNCYRAMVNMKMLVKWS